MTRRYTGGFISATEQATDANTANGIYTLSDAAALTAAGNFPTGRWTPQRSLRLRSSASAYLNRTTVSPTLGTKWTLSFWMKSCNVTTSGSTSYDLLFNTPTHNTDKTFLGFSKYAGYDNFELYLAQHNGSSSAYYSLKTSQTFRDPSAWYHIVYEWDTTQSVASDRIKMYVNGSRVTAFSVASYPPLNHINGWQTAGKNFTIGYGDSADYFNGYMSEINFIDGTPLSALYFGQTDPETGTWVPKKYTGTYGNNGFYLPFSDNTTTTTLGRNFAPGSQNLYTYSEQLDNAAWGKQNVTVTANAIANPIDGSVTAEKIVESATNAAHALYRAVDTVAQVAGQSYTTSWYMKAAGRNIVRIYWWSVSGNGLNVYYDMSTGKATMTNNQNGGYWNATMQDVGNGWFRCSVTGVATATGTDIYWGLYQTQGTDSYLGDGSSGVYMYGLQSEIARTPTTYTATTSSYVTGDWTVNNISLTAGVTYDSMVDVPGIAAVSSQTDVGGVQCGNYCTWNPVSPTGNVTFSNGNLTATSTVNSIKTVIGTIAADTSNKWYFEQTITAQSDAYRCWLGFIEPSMRTDETGGFYLPDAPGFSATWNSGNTTVTYGTSSKFTSSATGSFDITTATVSDTKAVNDVYMFAYDGTTGKIWFGKNGSWFGSGQPATGGNPAGVLSNKYNYTPAASMNVTGAGNAVTLNCGQRPFSYTPPTGFKSLCTKNLSNPVIKRPSDHFDVKTWTGNGASQLIGNTVKQSSAYPISKSLRFRAANTAYLSRLPSNGMSVGNQYTHTFSAWIKRGSGSTGEFPLYSSAQDANWRYYARIEQNNIRVYFNNAGTATEVLSANIFPDSRQWHHVVIAIDTTQTVNFNRVKLYWDGQLLANSTSSSYPAQNSATRWGNGGSPHYIGRKDTADTLWDGQMAEINIIDGQQLTASSFGAFDANNNWVPQRYTGSYGTMGSYLPLTGGPSLGTSTYGSYFGGANSCVTTATQIIPTGSFTLEAWVYPTSSSTTQTIFAQGTSTGDSARVWMGIESGEYVGSVTGQPRWAVQIGGTEAGSSFAPVLNQWHYVAMTFDGSTIRLYVNGVLAGSASTSTNASNSVLRIGEHSYSSSYKWYGYISNARVSNIVRSVSTIPTSNLTSDANTRFLTLVGSTLVDSSSNAYTITANTCSAPSVIYPFTPAPTYSTYFPGSASLGFASNAAWGLTGDFTIEGWIYRTTTSDSSMCVQFNGTNYFALNVQPGTGFNIYLNTGASAVTDIVPQINTWNHVALVRSGSTVKLYLNGIASGTTWTNSSTLGYSAQAFYIGAYNGQASGSTIGNISNFRLVNGTAVYTSNFTPSTSPLTAVTNTKLLTCQSSAFIDNSSNNFTTTFAGTPAISATNIPPLANTIGMDSSGRNNHFGSIGIDHNSGAISYDLLLDSPTDVVDSNGNLVGNYCILSTAENGSGTTFSNGALDIYIASSGVGTTGTMSVTSGKWYWEVTPTATSNANSFYTSVVDMDNFSLSNATQTSFYNTPYMWTYYGVASGASGQKGTNGVSGWTTYGLPYGVGDIIGVALDMDNGTLTYYKNGSSQGVAFTGFNGKRIAPAVLNGASSNSVNINVNFGQRPFAFTPPSGFKSLNTKNLKDAGSYNLPDNFGNFVNTPDLVWLKGRSGATYPTLFDTVRGPGVRLFNSLTDAQSQDLTELNSFIPNGFTLGSNGDANTAGATYVSWNWNRGQIPGFDIVTYTGNGTAGNQIKHNLGVTPSMIIIKSMSASLTNWPVYHSGIGTLSNTTVLYLNTTDYLGNITGNLWNSTNPGNQYFTVGDTAQNNSSSNSYVAYLWAEVPGFSKFGTYTGNTNADGPFIYCGFKPKYVMFKKTSGADSWFVLDSARNTYNGMQKWFAIHTSGSEYDTSSGRVDFVSNGFKIRTADAGPNTGNFIYAAFAESPFKYANAR